MSDWLQNCITFFLVFIIPVWNFDSMALLSRLIPTLLTGLIPALLLSMFNNTYILSNSLALLFISVLGNFFLDNPTVVHVRDIMTLFFMLQLTLVLDYIISLSFSSSITNFLMFS